jgi:pyruvate formate lyase activating enzyme
VDAEQEGAIARFTRIKPDIPYALLTFSPNFYLHDLPCTSLQHTQEAEAASREAGLTNVRIGKRHLPGLDWL